MGDTINRGAVAAKQWGKGFWSDYAERVGSTLLYGLITLLTAMGPLDLSWEKIWPIVGLPVVLAAIKGLLANMKNQGTGASLLPDPPGPVISDRGYTTVAFSIMIFGAALIAATIWPWLYTSLQ